MLLYDILKISGHFLTSLRTNLSASRWSFYEKKETGSGLPTPSSLIYDQK